MEDEMEEEYTSKNFDHSQQAYAREAKTLRKQVDKELERTKIELSKLSHQDFDCEHDAQEQLRRWAKSLKYHRVMNIQTTIRHVKKGRGRPRLNEHLDKKHRIKKNLPNDIFDG